MTKTATCIEKVDTKSKKEKERKRSFKGHKKSMWLKFNLVSDVALLTGSTTLSHSLHNVSPPLSFSLSLQQLFQFFFLFRDKRNKQQKRFVFLSSSVFFLT